MEWYDTCSLIPEPFYLPSRLFSINPVGIGTPLSESLTSYICRLAEAHCVHVGTLVTEEIAPLMGKDYLRKIVNRGGKGFSDCAVGLNGVGPGAKDCILALKALTGRKDLEYLSLLPWSNFLPSRGLLRKNRAWCPVCISEWEEVDQVYGPLLWNISEVEICIKHFVSLSTNCPNPTCQQVQPILNRYTRPGYCFKCRERLGRNSKDFMQLDTSSQIFEWQFFKAKCIGELIESGTKLNTSTSDVSNNLSAYAQQITNGNIAEFARLISVPKVTFWDWHSGRIKPVLIGLLKVCFCIGITLVELLTDTPRKINKNNVRTLTNVVQYPTYLERKKFNVSLVKHHLQFVALSNEFPPQSILKVSKNLGYDRKQLYKFFPELCRSISKRYLIHIRSERSKRIARTSKEIREAVTDIVNSGTYPSGKLVEKVIGKPGALKELDIREVWRKCVKNINTEK